MTSARTLLALALALAAVVYLPSAPALAAEAAAAVVHVMPGELHKCTQALEAEAEAAATSAWPGAVRTVRCVLGPGVFRDHIEHFGSGRLEVVGSGGGTTVMEGSVPVTGVSWALARLPHLNTTNHSHVYSAKLPPALRIPNIEQAFVDGGWISEARFPNTDLDKVLSLNSWAFCGKGTYHGYCEDRPDKWSDLKAHNVNWTGALATLSIGGRYTTYTRRVTSHTRSGFQFDGQLGPGPGSAKSEKPGGRYWLSGKLGMLQVVARVPHPAPLHWFRSRLVLICCPAR